MAFKLNGWSAFTKKEEEETFEPAWMGADISKEEWEKMTPEQKKQYEKKGLSTNK